MDDSSSSLLIFLSGNPHSLEGWEWTKDWSSDPDQELSLSRCNYLNLHCWRSQSSHLFAQTFRNTWEHSGSTTHNDIAVKIFSDINIALEDWMIGDFMETWHFFTNDHRLEESFRASESLWANCDGLSVRKFIDFVVLSWRVIGYIG